LRRYLRRQVGRLWDEVYAGIRARVDARSVLGLHVLKHVRSEVTQGVVFDRGVLSSLGFSHLLPVEGLYVDPSTGLLCYAPRRRCPAPVEELDLVPVSDTEEYRRIGGLWYRFELARRFERRVVQSKRQCGRKMIRLIESGALGPLVNRSRHLGWRLDEE